MFILTVSYDKKTIVYKFNEYNEALDFMTDATIQIAKQYGVERAMIRNKTKNLFICKLRGLGLVYSTIVEQTTERLYLLWAVNDKTGGEECVMIEPDTHHACMVNKSKFNPSANVRFIVREC